MEKRDDALRQKAATALRTAMSGLLEELPGGGLNLIVGKSLLKPEVLSLKAKIFRLEAGEKLTDRIIKEMSTDYLEMINNLEEKVATVEAERDANIKEIIALRERLRFAETDAGNFREARDAASAKSERFVKKLVETTAKKNDYYSAIEAIIDTLADVKKKTTKKKLLDYFEKIRKIVAPLQE